MPRHLPEGDANKAKELGTEQTPDAYVAEMVSVFREVRRVLRDDGTCWLNIGDSYAGSWGARGRGEGTNAARPDLESKYGTDTPGRHGFSSLGIKPKDLIGIPWLLAFALRADGWFLRQEIIWRKPNPMPESVTDRCTKAHEQVFLLTKRPRYFFDQYAIREAPSGRTDPMGIKNASRGRAKKSHVLDGSVGANRRSVWDIATQPYSGAHFATMPQELAATCIKVGTSMQGQCPNCGAPWVPGSHVAMRWAPSCTCPAHQPVPQVVLDPFAGAGTTGLAADRLQRSAVLIELNPTYAALARERINMDGGMFSGAAE